MAKFEILNLVISSFAPQLIRFFFGSTSFFGTKTWINFHEWRAPRVSEFCHFLGPPWCRQPKSERTTKITVFVSKGVLQRVFKTLECLKYSTVLCNVMFDTAYNQFYKLSFHILYSSFRSSKALLCQIRNIFLSLFCLYNYFWII